MNARNKQGGSKQGKTAEPTGTYLQQAEAKIRGAAGNVINSEVRAWMNQQQAAGVPVDQLLDAWNAPENAEFVKQHKAHTRVIYIVEELERKVEYQAERRAELAAELRDAKGDAVTDLAAESANKLISTIAKFKTYSRFLGALKNRIDADKAPAEIFDTVSQFALNDLAKNASHLTSRNTDWQVNEQRIAEVAALGEVASLFIDIARV